MCVMTGQPRNAETPVEYLLSWVTANSAFFDRNQGQIPAEAVYMQPGDWLLKAKSITRCASLSKRC